MRTSEAIAKRHATYQVEDLRCLPFIQQARGAGARNARDFARMLNDWKIPGPTNYMWTESAVLRCLRRLRVAGLDRGSKSAHDARRAKGAKEIGVIKVPK